jgi:single-strand DNA-binding protein
MMQLVLTGNIGQDAVTKISNGKSNVTFSIADTRRWKDAEGNQKEETTWVSCIMPETAVAKFLKAGTKVLVMGSPRITSYKDKSNQWRAGLNLNVDRIELLSPKKEDQPGEPVGSGVAAAFEAEGGNDNDLPF